MKQLGKPLFLIRFNRQLIHNSGSLIRVVLLVVVVYTTFSVPSVVYAGGKGNPGRVMDPGMARVYILDVYSGIAEVESGKIQSIRIVQVPFQYLEAGVQGACEELEVTRVIGTVPVEKDGSAYFVVPADIPLRFEAVDENGKAVGCSRTIVLLKPNTVRGFSGLNESADVTPPAIIEVPAALKKDPVSPLLPVNVGNE